MKRKREEKENEQPWMVFRFCDRTPCLGPRHCGWFYGPGYGDESKRGKPVYPEGT